MLKDCAQHHITVLPVECVHVQIAYAVTQNFAKVASDLQPIAVLPDVSWHTDVICIYTVSTTGMDTCLPGVSTHGDFQG